MTKLIIDKKEHMYAFGIEVGSDAKVLMTNNLSRLVWCKGSSTLIGARGCGHSISKSKLAIRTFKMNGNDILYLNEIKLFEGGRLSQNRLLAYQDIIDSHFGKNSVSLISKNETIIFGEDLISNYIQQYLIKPSYHNEHINNEVNRIFGSKRKQY